MIVIALILEFEKVYLGYWRNGVHCFEKHDYIFAVIGVVIMSVRLSVVLCDETKEHTANIFTPHTRIITLVLWHLQRLTGDVAVHLIFALKVINSYSKRTEFDRFLLYNVSTVRTSEIKFNYCIQENICYEVL